MKDFFKMLCACIVAFFVVGFGMFMFTFVLFGLIAAAAGTAPKPTMQNNSVLAFDLSVNIQDSPTAETGEEIIAEALGNGSPTKLQLRAVIDAIDAAASDHRIKGLYLQGSFSPSNYGSGYAAILEVRAAVERFRASGKPVIAYMVSPNARDYLMFSTADRIVFNPMGMTMIPGLNAEVMYYGGMFEKYGIGVQVARAGEYKSAGESFSKSEMSEQEREQLTALLSDVWSGFLDAVSESRGIDPGALQDVIDRNGILNAERALDAGLVDEIAYFSDILSDLKRLTGEPESEETFRQVSMADYIASRTPAPGHVVRGPKVAVVYAEGQIISGDSSPGYVGGDGFARDIRALRQDDDVKAVVLRVNSPGGGVMASEVMRKELDLLHEQVPLVVSMGTVAASGGYWISAGSDRIFAQPNTITGSIGVIAIMPNFKGLAERFALNVESVETARNADIFSIMKPRDEEAMGIIQTYINETYDGFLNLVSDGRNIDRVTLEGIAGGRVWSGAEALDNGLVDEIGGLDAAIEHAASLAGLDYYAVVDYPAPRSFFDELLERLEKKGSPISGVLPDSRIRSYIEKSLRTIEALNDPQGAYALMPTFIELN